MQAIELYGFWRTCLLAILPERHEECMRAKAFAVNQQIRDDNRLVRHDPL
jgi:hypothetical protein